MSLSKKESSTNNTLNSPSKAKTLNPNAAEFVPFSLRSSSQTGSTSYTSDASARSVSINKAILDRSGSSVSNASDDEALQYWRHQLPDDITPDFKVMTEDEPQGQGGFSLSSLSLHDPGDNSGFSGGGYVLNEQQESSTQHFNGLSFSDKMRYAAASSREDMNSSNYLNLPTKPWDKHVINSEHVYGRDVHQYNGNHRHEIMGDMMSDPAMVENSDMNPLEYLASHFPGFAAESLAEVYFANGCNLNLTIEMLTQLELQVDGGFEQNMDSKTLSSPNLSALDFPALSVGDSHNGSSIYSGDDTRPNGNPFQVSDKENILFSKSGASFSSRGAVDFVSAVRRLASQDSGVWKYERNGSADSTVGSSRSSHVLASSFNGHGKGVYADRSQTRSSGRAAPVWLETGEAVANMYSELREEARDHARLRNVCFEQARQAYLIGNKALAKEMSARGQLHNMQMKAAHGKAQESIYRQRNPVSPEMQGNGRGHKQMIDLHGLHVSEAIHVLKHELSALRSTARAAGQRLQVYICVGTGHHTRGSRTPARLPIAVQRYLLEEEGLEYSEPQPGLLRVVLY